MINNAREEWLHKQLAEQYEQIRTLKTYYEHVLSEAEAQAYRIRSMISNCHLIPYGFYYNQPILMCFRNLKDNNRNGTGVPIIPYGSVGYIKDRYHLVEFDLPPSILIAEKAEPSLTPSIFTLFVTPEEAAKMANAYRMKDMENYAAD